MPWRFGTDVEAYEAAAGRLLRGRPVEHTISLTVLERARRSGPGPGERFGWWTDGRGAVTGAVSHTPPFEVLLGVVPEPAVAPLVAELAAGGPPISGVNGRTAVATAVAERWTRATGGTATVAVRHRLHRLARLAAPPATPGRARPAVAGDAPLLEAWLRAFTSESGAGMGDPGRTVAERLDHDGWVLWEDDAGEPVAMAGLTLPAAGVVRVAPVYTPPDRRRRGFGAAVTAAVTATGLAQGARDVVLFTDVANPTANALYARLGYLPVEERVTIRLERGAA